MTTGDLARPESATFRTLRQRGDALPIVMAAAFCVLPALGQFMAPFPQTDEALLVVYAEQLLAGRFPIRDFFTVYGPAGPATLATIFSVTGPNVIAERTLGLIYHVAVATGVVRLTRVYGRTASCAAGIASALLMLPVGLTAYAWFGGLALAIWSLALLTVPSGNQSKLTAGLLGGLASAWRIEMLALLLAATPLMWRNKVGRPYLVGVAIGVAPMVAYLTWVGRAAVAEVGSRLGTNAQLEWIPTSVWVNLIVLFLSTGTLVVVVLRQPPRQRVAVAYAVLAIALLPQALQRIDVFHVTYVLCVVAPLGIASVTVLTQSADAGANHRTEPGNPKVMMGVVLAALAATTIGTLAVNYSKVSELTHSGRTIPVDQTHKARLSAQLQMISRTIPRGSSVFIGAEDMSVPTYGDLHLYHLLPEYRADAYYLEFPPDIAHRPSALVQDVLHADALILTDVPRWQSELLYPHIGQGGDDVNRAVVSNFCATRSVPPVTVYLRCDK